MQSNTKVCLEKSDIAKLVTLAFNSAEITNIIELKEGWFNTVYLIKLNSNIPSIPSQVILKVGPPEDADILSYEKNIITSEINCMQLIESNTHIPMPKILFSDLSRSVIPYQYFFMQYVSGDILRSVKDKLNQNQWQKINYQIGEITSQLHTFKNNHFGYFNLEPNFNNWFDAFKHMCEGLFKDANTYNITLPLNLSEFESLIANYQDAFLEVTQPQLIHWDLSDGNIFIEKQQDDHYKVKNIIDFERAIWGDPLMEINIFDLNADHSAYFSGYKQNLLLSRNQKTRRKFYNIYLFLVIVIEDGPRNYSDKSAVKWAFEELDKLVDHFKSLS